MRDDLGTEVGCPRPATRVVSLVPSLTEAIASVDPASLVGVTQWCTHPADLDVVRVRGTKNPDCALVASLHPDIVIANKEENRRIDVDRLREQGVPVWVTDIESVDDAFTSMRRMFEGALGWQPPTWLDEAAEIWAQPARLPALRTITCIWRDPWMVVGGRTFTADLLRRLGLDPLFTDHGERYPALGLEELRDCAPDLVLLPDEPYVFTPEDGPEAFAGFTTSLVEGRLLTWYGPSLVQAREALEQAIVSAIRSRR